mgnify:FL=1
MTNKKFKKAAMALALTACVAVTPLAANAETPENAVPVENKERSEAETPTQQASESANTAPVENQEHENAEGILEDRETEDKKITTDVEYTDREFTYNEDGTVKSEESSGHIVQKEMDKSTEAAAGEGKDSEGSAKTPEAGETTEEGKGIEAPDADISEPVKDAEGKIIGTASKEERTEQETTITPTSPDSEKLVDSTVNPDGSVTNRYETSHTADKTTTNTTTGTVTADTKEIFVTDGKEVDLKQELGKDYQEKLKWDTVDGTSFNGYTVGSMEEDGDRQTYTLTKHTEDTDLEMTGEDLAKLLEADYTKTENDDGSYTLTKSIRTSAGEQTVYITVTGNKATRTVDTTLKVDVKKSEHTGSAEVKQDDVLLPNKTDKTLTFTDKNSNIFNVDLDELLQKPDKTESTNAAGDKVITVKDGSKTYEIIYHETNEYTDAQVKDLSADELAGLLNSNSANGKFIVKDGKVCKVVNDEACEISYNDATKLLKKVQISVTMTDADNQLSKDNGTLEDAKLRAKKDALQKALAEAIYACTGTTVDPSSLPITDEDVSLPEGVDNVSANAAKLKRTYTYTASDGKQYTFTYRFAYDDTRNHITGFGDDVKKVGYFTGGIHVKPEEDVEAADGKTDHKRTLIESGIFVSGNATTDANGAYTTITKDSPLYGLGVDFKTAPKNAVAGSIKYDDTGRIIEYQTTDGKTIKLSYESVEVPDSNLPSYAPVDGKTNINSKSFTRVTWEAWDLGEIRNEEQADDQWTISSGKDESGGLTYTIVDKKNNVTYDDLIRVGSNSYTKTVTDENGVKTTYTVTVEPGSLSESRALTELAERYGVDAAAITVKDGVASFTKDGKQYQVSYGSQLKIETVLTTEGTVTTDADQAELLEKIQQMQKDLQDGEILDVGGYQVTISTSKDEIIEILHKVGETTDFTRLTREELKALLEKEKAEADAAGKSYTGDMDVSHPEYSNKNLYGKPNNSLYDSFRKTYLSYDGNYIQHLELNATTKADLLKDADGNVHQTDCVLTDKKLEYSDDLNKLIDSQGTSVVNLQDKIGYDIPMDRYEYARTSFSDGDKLNWNVRNNHPTASTYYKVSGTVAYNQYKPADGTSDLTKEQAEALLKQLQAEGYADASIVTFYTTEHEHQQTERNASYRIYLNKSELISYGYLSYDSNTCTNAHNWNQAMYGLSNKYFNPDAYCGGYDLGLTGFRQVEDGTFVAQGKKTITVSRILPATTLTNNHLTITDSAQKADTGSGVSGRYNYTTTVSGSRVNYSALGTATHETWKEAAQQTTERTGEQGDGTLSYTYRSTQDASVDAESAHKEETVVRHGTADYEYTYTASKDEVEITTDSRTETTTPETPDTPDTPASPEGPTTPPVQDATPDDAETPVTPENPANPSVQDATPDTVAALPKTGVNWTAALAMALSGMALTVAGAFTSLFAKSKH